MLVQPASWRQRSGCGLRRLKIFNRWFGRHVNEDA
jgi:hypothetical protein